jgi:ankyrin repeat protein
MSLNAAEEAARERARKLLFRENQPEIRRKQLLAKQAEIRITNAIVVDRLESANEELLIAATRARRDKIEKALEAGADINHRGPSLNTALHRATDNSHDEIIKLLLEKGANIDCQNETGKTPLMKACFYNHMSCIRLLIESKADLNLKDKQDGWSALHRACAEGHDVVCRVLLGYGADRELLADKTSKMTSNGLVDNDEQSTAMMLAEEHGNECCIDLLNNDDLHGKELREWFG